MDTLHKNMTKAELLHHTAFAIFMKNVRNCANNPAAQLVWPECMCKSDPDFTIFADTAIEFLRQLERRATDTSDSNATVSDMGTAIVPDAGMDGTANVPNATVPDTDTEGTARQDTNDLNTNDLNTTDP